MADCPKKDVCTLLTDKTFQKMPGLLQRFRQNFCDSEFALCARYQVAVECGDAAVPEPMLPTQIDWAQQLVRENKTAKTPPKQNC